MIADAMRMRGRGDWLAALEAGGIPCSPVNGIDEVFADPQVRARGLQVNVDHPAREALPLVASPLRLSATPVRYRSAPPTLGQHSEEVLRESGLSPQEIDELRARGVIS